MKKAMKKILAAVAALLLAAGLMHPGEAAAAAKLSAGELFTDRDLAQEADLKDAVTITVQDGEDIRIADAGTYVLSGSADSVTVLVEAGDDDKVQIVLSGVNIINSSRPVIYVKSADKVFVTTAADSALKVTGAFSTDGSVKTDGVIFSKEDLTLNGTAVLTIASTENGIVSKDDLKITGGTYAITAASKAIEANDSIRVAGGTFTINAGTDGLHAENDAAEGYIFIGGGTFAISAGDDGIHADALVQIDGGTFDIAAAEGIEGTYIQLNSGTIDIKATDDGINAARKSGAWTPTVEINGGDITVAMGPGDTDGIDSNGSIIVNGGTVSVTGNSTFDYDGNALFNGGVIIVNGQQVSSIPNQMMGGRGGWGSGGYSDGGWGNPGGWGGGYSEGGWDGGGQHGGGRRGR